MHWATGECMSFHQWQITFAQTTCLPCPTEIPLFLAAPCVLAVMSATVASVPHPCCLHSLVASWPVSVEIQDQSVEPHCLPTQSVAAVSDLSDAGWYVAALPGFAEKLPDAPQPPCAHSHCLWVISEAVYKNKMKSMRHRIRDFILLTKCALVDWLFQCFINYYSMMNDASVYSWVWEWSSEGSHYEDYSLLVCSTMQFGRSLPTYHRNLLPQSSG